MASFVKTSFNEIGDRLFYFHYEVLKIIIAIYRKKKTNISVSDLLLSNLEQFE